MNGQRRTVVRLFVSALLALLALAAVTGLAGVASAAAPTTPVNVVCTSPVAYGDTVDCQAASLDASYDFGPPGTFTFDPGRSLPATWAPASTCAVDGSFCYVTATLGRPAGATPREVTFSVSFVGKDGSRGSAQVVVDVGLRSTTTAVDCGATEQALGARTHCVVSVVDQPDGDPAVPAQLPAGVVGMAASSSDPGDTITYDQPSADGSTCVAAVAADELTCGFSLQLDGTHGLHTIAASYAGDPAVDEQVSAGAVQVANGPRVQPTLALSCPASVPANALVATCSVTVASATPGDPTPTGQVAFDQSSTAVDWAAAGTTCTLVDGTCSVSYAVFAGTESSSPPPVRASYAGDDTYLPWSASQQVAIALLPAVSSTTCDSATPAPGAVLSCTFTVSAQGAPVPVGPLDAIVPVTSSGTISCALVAPVGCGHYDTPSATVTEFTVALSSDPGPQLVVVNYSGDDYGFIAGSGSGFSFTTGFVTPPIASPPAPPPPPVVAQAPPPPVTVVRATTTSKLACGAPVAYGHPVRCTVTVSSHGGVASGTVEVAPLPGPHPAFAAVSCALSTQGECAVSLPLSALPKATVGVLVSYLGSDGFLPSATHGAVSVRAVATVAHVSCDHPVVRTGGVLHCVASVRTEFGAAAGAPPAHPYQVTVSAKGDGIVYDKAAGAGSGESSPRQCVWHRSAATLRCGFSVRPGSTAGLRLLKVHYAGAAGRVHDAASVASVTYRVVTS